MIQINGATEVYGIIGNPVRHSFSPAMHSAAFQSIGRNAVYLPFLSTKDQLAELLKAFELIGLQGFNVTVPFKEAILHHLDEVDQAAKVLGSVNTVLFGPDGWKGYSTDGPGFLRGLTEQGWEPKNKRICLLGAGGSAKAIAWSLASAKVASITLLNRTLDRALELKTMLESYFPQVEFLLEDQLEEYDLLINSTSLGMQGGCPANDELIAKSLRVSDIIYNPRETELLQKAQALGKKTQNGISMLLYQGVEAFEIWTKQPAPVTIMQQSLEESLQLLSP